MAFPSLADGALEFLDMSGVLPIQVQALASATVDRGKRSETWGAAATLDGPYVFDDSPGTGRRQAATGDTIAGDAVLYVHAGGPDLPAGALGKGDRVIVRGVTYTVANVVSFDELAESRACVLKAVGRP